MSKKILLIPAAGVGERMKIGYPKQYYPLFENRTMLEVTVNRMLGMSIFDRVAVVVSENDAYIDRCRFEGAVEIHRCGGDTRAQSVLNGLTALHAEPDDWVFVHDAARPCIDKESIVRLVDTIESEAVDGAILALPVTDTLKWVNDDAMIEKTIDRSRCFRAQTPQVFQAQALLTALQNAIEPVTDEASAMEMQGTRIKVVEGSAFNIKVTYPEDLKWVRSYINQLSLTKESVQ